MSFQYAGVRISTENPNSSILEAIYIPGSPAEIQTPAYWKLYIYMRESSGKPNSRILETIYIYIYIRGIPVEIRTPAYWKLYI